MQTLNACTMAQISGYLSACFDSYTKAACDTFFNDTANSACLACIAPSGAGPAGTANSGGMLYDYMGTPFSVNVPGCIALEDPTKGPACAQALEPFYQCQEQACSSAACDAASDADYQACTYSSQTGACSAQDRSVASACGSDFVDGGAGTSQCGTHVQVLNAICGSGM